MDNSIGIKIGVIVENLSLIFCSSVIIQISFAEEIELEVWEGEIFPVEREEEIEEVRINFFVSSDEGTSFAEWNIDHEKFGSSGGIITSILASSNSFSLKGLEGFDNI